MVLCLERGRGKWSGLGQLQELIAPQGERTLGNIVKGESLMGPGAKGEREAVGHWVEPWERRQVRWASGGRPDGHQALLYPPLLSPFPCSREQMPACWNPSRWGRERWCRLGPPVERAARHSTAQRGRSLARGLRGTAGSRGQIPLGTCSWNQVRVGLQ